MAKRKKRSGRPGSRPVTSLALAERRVDRLDQALVAGDADQVQAMIAQLVNAPDHVAEALTRRLIAGRAAAPIIAFEFIAALGGPRADTFLQRIAAHREAEDIVRFGAQRRLGWPEDGDAKRRLAFLESLAAPDRTLVEAARQGSDQWPPSSEIYEEVLGYLVAMPSKRRRSVAESIIAEVGPQADWLLHSLLQIDDRPLQRLVLNELVRQRDPGALSSLRRLASSTKDAALRPDALAAEQRLRLQVVGAPGSSPRRLPPVERALLSVVDNDGGQAALLVRALSPGAFLVVNLFFNDHWGVKTVAGSAVTDIDGVNFIIEGFEEAELDMVEVDAAAVRGAVAAALETNRVSGKPFPPAFELWEPLLHETYPATEDEPMVRPSLDDAPYIGRKELVQNSGRLLDGSFFNAWLFDPEETTLALLGTPLPTSSRWGAAQYRSLVNRLVGETSRAQIRQRLRRQAWLLDQEGELEERDLALATAAELASAGPTELAKQPFLRRLIERSVANALTEFGVEDDDP